MIRMTMKRSRLISALLALLTILCGAALKLFPPASLQFDRLYRSAGNSSCLFHCLCNCKMAPLSALRQVYSNYRASERMSVLRTANSMNFLLPRLNTENSSFFAATFLPDR